MSEQSMIVHCPRCGAAIEITPEVRDIHVNQVPGSWGRIIFEFIPVHKEHICKR